MNKSHASGCVYVLIVSVIGALIYGSCLYSSIMFMTSFAPRGFDWGIGAFFGAISVALGGGVIFFVGSLILSTAVRSPSGEAGESRSAGCTTVLSAFFATGLLSLAFLQEWTRPAADRATAMIWALLVSAGLGLIGALQIVLVGAKIGEDPDHT